MIAPLVEGYNNKVFSDLEEVGLQGQIHTRLASIILKKVSVKERRM